KCSVSGTPGLLLTGRRAPIGRAHDRPNSGSNLRLDAPRGALIGQRMVIFRHPWLAALPALSLLVLVPACGGVDTMDTASATATAGATADPTPGPTPGTSLGPTTGSTGDSPTGTTTGDPTTGGTTTGTTAVTTDPTTGGTTTGTTGD